MFSGEEREEDEWNLYRVARERNGRKVLLLLIKYYKFLIGNNAGDVPTQKVTGDSRWSERHGDYALTTGMYKIFLVSTPHKFS